MGRGLRESPRPSRGCEVKTIFLKILRCYLSFSLSFPPEGTVGFSKDYLPALSANGMCAGYSCFTFFSVLIYKMVHINRYNPHKQKLSEVINNF